ncbi:hypothetical protein SDC9_175950 [bioreactor metagenome]|uniref:Uncharacterized protein n=1 Tax=bioreactor metagenome TaxID=1076179 RepID=A0A645GNL3_9ZZZZ
MQLRIGKDQYDCRHGNDQQQGDVFSQFVILRVINRKIDTGDGDEKHADLLNVSPEEHLLLGLRQHLQKRTDGPDGDADDLENIRLCAGDGSILNGIRRDDKQKSQSATNDKDISNRHLKTDPLLRVRTNQWRKRKTKDGSTRIPMKIIERFRLVERDTERRNSSEVITS